MTNSEAKDALFNRTPVMYNGIVYSHVKQIIYWIDDNGQFRISLTLVDQNQNSRNQARVEDVSLYDIRNQTTTFLY